VGHLEKKESGPNPKEIYNFKILIPFKICTKFELAKSMPSQTKKNQIKYGSIGNQIRNNFTYWNFSIFKMDFE
jgi:hypothetical protein